MAVIIEMNEAQAKIVLQALEEWFRLRMGQDFDLANGLAFLGYKHDKDHPERFDAAIQRRNSIQAVMRAMFSIAWPHCMRLGSNMQKPAPYIRHGSPS